MNKDKNNFDYWDKYYGSGKDKKHSYTDYDKKYGNRSPKDNHYNKKYSSKKYEPEGRIVGSEYKLKPRQRKRRRSPALRLTILIIVVFLAGFFTFYAIDNHLFSKKTADNTQSLLKADNSSNNISITSENNSDIKDTSKTGTQSSDNTVQETKISNTGSQQNQNSSDSSNQSIWQALIVFFKNLGKKQLETDNYPKKITINFYFSILGNEEKFGSEQRTIIAGSPQNAAVNAVNELLKGPYENFNFAVIPAGTKLMGVEVSNKIATVNFSQEFLSESLDSRILDDYIIYTIVDTLTEIPEIEAVSFLIDGKEIKEYGNVDLRLPAIRNEKYLD
ncbi:MAG: GerMN domain-containing protein [Actinobacteria bacterium]|nr:GerMN domain-containing protein [Actinomycetota bacterium]